MAVLRRGERGDRTRIVVGATMHQAQTGRARDCSAYVSTWQQVPALRHTAKDDTLTLVVPSSPLVRRPGWHVALLIPRKKWAEKWGGGRHAPHRVAARVVPVGALPRCWLWGGRGCFPDRWLWWSGSAFAPRFRGSRSACRLWEERRNLVWGQRRLNTPCHARLRSSIPKGAPWSQIDCNRCNPRPHVKPRRAVKALAPQRGRAPSPCCVHEVVAAVACKCFPDRSDTRSTTLRFPLPRPTETHGLAWTDKPDDGRTNSNGSAAFSPPRHRQREENRAILRCDIISSECLRRKKCAHNSGLLCANMHRTL